VAEANKQDVLDISQQPPKSQIIKKQHQQQPQPQQREMADVGSRWSVSSSAASEFRVNAFFWVPTPFPNGAIGRCRVI
jgi:hypothetical protein